MELEELKSVWVKVINKECIKYEFSQNKAKEMIQKKSNTLLTKLENQLRYKRWFCFIIGGITIPISSIYLFIKDDSNYLFENIFSPIEMFSIILILGLALIFLGINISLNYKKIIALKTTSENLKVTLKRVSHILKAIMKTTVYYDTIIVPFISFLVLYRIFFNEESFLFDIRILYILLGTLITFLFIRYVSKRQQETRFGPFVKNLEACILDMDVLDD